MNNNLILNKIKFKNKKCFLLIYLFLLNYIYIPKKSYPNEMRI